MSAKRFWPHAKRNERFKQLLDKARDGDAEAPGDLWREFQFVYGEDEP